MKNPILTMLNTNSNMNNAIGIINTLKNGNPEAIMNQLVNTNPQFRQFVEANKGKSPEQIAQENGIDFNMIKSFLYK